MQSKFPPFEMMKGGAAVWSADGHSIDMPYLRVVAFVGVVVKRASSVQGARLIER
jgi:hypothetical protein